MADESVIKRIIGLRELAKNNANSEEAATASAIADKLIAKYRVEEELLNPKTSKVILDSNYIYTTGRVVGWKAALVSIIAKAYSCATCIVYTKPEGRKVSSFQLAGTQEDIDIVHYMFGWISSEIERLTKVNGKDKGHIFCNSYAEGFVDAIKTKLYNNNQDRKAENADSEYCAALVRIDNRTEQSLSFLKSSFKLVKNTYQNKSYIDPKGFKQGYDKGINTNLSKGLN